MTKIPRSIVRVLVGLGLMSGSAACVGLPPLGPGSTDAQTDGVTTDADATGSPLPSSADPTQGQAEGPTDDGPTGGGCGNGLVDDGEECDLGVNNGAGLECTAQCRLNVCGDGYVGPGEACDDGNDDEFDDCSAQCRRPGCGDGVVTGGEECDEGAANDPNGSCRPDCVRASCGDGVVYAGVERCDGDDVGDQSCRSKGYDGGVLACSEDCSSYDVSGCFACGNGEQERDEACDGRIPEGLSCQDFAPPGTEASGGALACTNACTIDDRACTFCGDGEREGGEACDANDFGARTCASELGPLYDGVLGCGSSCELELGGCCRVAGGPCESADDCCVGGCIGGTCDAA